MMDTQPGSAPFVELALARGLRSYERVKLVLLVLVLILVTVSDLYVVGLVHSGHALSKQNHQSLVILQCAVANGENNDKPLTPAAERAKFERCVARG